MSGSLGVNHGKQIPSEFFRFAQFIRTCEDLYLNTHESSPNGLAGLVSRPVESVLDFFRQFHPVDQPCFEISSSNDDGISCILKAGMPADLKTELFSLGKRRCLSLRQSAGGSLPIIPQVLQVSTTPQLRSSY